MILGHFAVGFAAKRAAPRTSLTVLLSSAMLLDLLWPLFLWLGIEHVRIAPGNTAFTPLDFESYPWSHSLLMAGLWALLAAWIYRVRTRYDRGALWVAIAVVSHWVLDVVVHRPDLPLVPWSDRRFGFSLWNNVPLTAAVEIAMFVAGLALYLATTRARGVMGHVSLWSLVAGMALLYAGAVGGTPPPNLEALKIVASCTSVLVFWFLWVDRTRELRVPA
jgi:membrane-bound metal-dependent hydrolase YbcI (DUF457 family)